MSGPEFVTFGCRLNTYETEVMRSHAEKAGMENAIVFNTCAVTAEATRQARQAIRKARAENPDAQIIVTGCAAQTDPEMFAAMPEVSRVLGNEEKLKPESWQRGANARVSVSDIMSVKRASPQLIDGLKERTRASCRCRTAAITAAPSASFPSGGAIRARSPRMTSSSRCAASSRPAIRKWC